MSFLVLPQHEQFYPEGLSYEVLENLGWIKLAPKFKDFPAPTAIFKDFQGECKPCLHHWHLLTLSLYLLASSCSLSSSIFLSLA